MLILLAGSPAWTAESEKAGTLAAVAAAQPETFGPEYRIGPGDQLGIEVWKDPALTRVVVLPDATFLQHQRPVSAGHCRRPQLVRDTLQDPDLPPGGEKTVIISFAYDDVPAGRDLETNILHKRGDVIVVP